MPKKARAAQNSELHQNKLFTYFRLGKLDKFYLASKGSTASEEIDFLDAAKLLETDNEERRAVGQDFFELLETNKGHLEEALRADHETVYAPTSSRDVISKLRRRLLLFKADQMLDFTEDDQQLWQMVIRDLQHGAVAKQTANNVWKAVEKVNQAREVLEILKGKFSLDGRNGEETPTVESRLNLREVILSEHFL